MAAITYRLRLQLRAHRAETALLIAVIALATAAVITIAAGAARTRSAPDRYVERFDVAFDALVTHEGSSPRADEIARLASVTRADPLTFVFGGLVGPTAGYEVLVFSGSPRAAGLHLVAGRRVRADDSTEFVATRSFVESVGATIGQSFDLLTLTDEQVASGGFGDPDLEGSAHAAHLVGVVDGLSRLDEPTPAAVFSPALLDDPSIGTALTLVAVDLAGDADLSRLRTELDGLVGGNRLTVEPASAVSDTLERAVEVQARGLSILALAAGLAVAVALGQLLTRRVRPTTEERQRLTAIGYTSRQLNAGATARGAVVSLSGTVIGALIAVGASPIFPLGFVRSIEPDPGMRVEVLVLLGTTASMAVALVVWVLVSVGGRARIGPATSSGAVDRLAATLPNQAAETGFRFAYTSSAGDRSSVWGSVAGVAVVIAALVAAITFGAALGRLIDEPARYGAYYDAAIGDNGADRLPVATTDRLAADPEVTDLTIFSLTDVRAGDATIPALGFDPVKGSGTPTLLDGRLPSSDDEVALGATTARELGTGVGGVVELAGPTATTTYEVTGLIVAPGFGENDGVGEGALMTGRSLSRLDPAATPLTATISVTGDTLEFMRRQPEFVEGVSPTQPFVPPVIANLARVRAIPFVLAAVIAGLAVLAVAHVTAGSVRTRRRDLAVLRALGADRTFVTRVVRWQATAFSIGASVLGVTVGLAAGRWVFTTYAHDMGVVDTVAVPVFAVAGAVAVLVVAANVAASLITRRARRSDPARVLRTE
jgi:hypothetical protein